MTVGELIDVLGTYPADMKVEVRDYDGEWVESSDAYITETKLRLTGY